MDLYAVLDYPNEGDGSIICEDCLFEVVKETSLNSRPLVDMSVVKLGEKCVGPCGLFIKDLETAP